MANNRRPETGSMQFGDDWSGVFIRGDNAFGNAMVMRRLLEALPEEFKKLHGFDIMGLERLCALLESSLQHNENYKSERQYMKDFNECLSPENGGEQGK